MRKYVSSILVILMLAGTTACSVASAANSAQAQPKSGTPGPTTPQRPGGAGAAVGKVVGVAPVTQGQLKQSLEYTGTLESGSQVNIVPQVSGRLEKLLVNVGDHVKTGDTIATLQQDTFQLAVEQAQANLSSAQAKLQTVQAGGRAENVANAQAALDAAQTKLNQLQNPSPSDVQAAQTTVDQDKAALTSAQAKLDAVKNPYTQADWATANAAVETAQTNLKAAQVKLTQVQAGSLPADVATQQAAVDVASAALLSAEDKFQMYQNGDVKDSGFTSNTDAVQAVQAAEDAYNAAVTKLKQLQAGALPADLQAAVSAVDAAQAAYSSATAKVATMKQGPLATDIAQAQSTVDTAKANLAAAQAKLNQLQHPTDSDIQLAQDAVTQAQQQVALQQQPYTAQDVQAARSAVDQAQAALDSAKVQLSQATLVAPFDGVVTQKLLSPGALVTQSTPIVTLNSSDLDVPVSFEESQLPLLKPGLGATLTVGAYPTETFTAKVAGIYPAADTKTHTFVAKVVPDDPGGKLHPGMFANVVVTAEQQNNAILVPVAAIVQVNGKDSVFVVADGKAQLRQVVQGAISGGNVEIQSGVKPGEQVVISGNASLNDGDPVRVQGASGQPGQPQGQGGQRQGQGGQGGQPSSQGGQPGQSSRPQGGGQPQGQGGAPQKN